MAKQKRQVFHSTLAKKDGWVVLLEKQVVSKHDAQKESERAAIEEARVTFKDGGLGHKSDGAIREERTYGSDPESLAARLSYALLFPRPRTPLGCGRRPAFQ
jgi:hypothetical protein